MLGEAGRDDIVVESAGTNAWDESPASDGSILIGVERNLDLSQHRARRLTPQMIEAADLVLVMSHEHLARVRELDSTANAYLLGGYGSSSPHAIQDPFGGELDDYRATADELEQELKGILDRIKAT
jgi:protein-tyrosine-phosphatase